MVSQFGSLGYTIMGKTADLTVVQKTIIDTSGVVVPGEVGILLIYAPNFFFLKGLAKDERPVSNSDM